jgi:phosphatidylserine decarboxylase
LKGRRNPLVAREGIPFLIAALGLCVYAYNYLDASYVAGACLLFVLLVLVFRDPRRRIPASPLGVVSPVDGRVVSVDEADEGVLHGRAHRIRIRIDSFGTYIARSPVEGFVRDLGSFEGNRVLGHPTHAMWIRTDEGDDVVLQFQGIRFGLAPKSFVDIGARVGQGQRCAYLRLARFAEVYLPVDCKLMVEPGQAIAAGVDLIGKLLHH